MSFLPLSQESRHNTKRITNVDMIISHEVLSLDALQLAVRQSISMAVANYYLTYVKDNVQKK